MPIENSRIPVLRRELLSCRVGSGVTFVLLCTAVALAILCGLKVLPGGVGGGSSITAAIFSGFTGILGLVSLCATLGFNLQANEARIREQTFSLLEPVAPPQPQEESCFQSEPAIDILSTVFKEYLPPQDVNQCRSVCKRWHGVIKGEFRTCVKVESCLALHKYYETVNKKDSVVLFWIVQTFLEWNDCRAALKVANQIQDLKWRIAAGLEIAKVRYRQGEEDGARAYVERVRKVDMYQMDSKKQFELNLAFAECDWELKNRQKVLDFLDHLLPKDYDRSLLNLMEKVAEGDLTSQEKERFTAFYHRFKNAEGEKYPDDRAKMAYIEWHLGCFDRAFLITEAWLDAGMRTLMGYTYLAYRFSAYVSKHPQKPEAFDLFTRFIREVESLTSNEIIQLECLQVYLHRCIALKNQEEAARIQALLQPLWEPVQVEYQTRRGAIAPDQVTWAQGILAQDSREAPRTVVEHLFFDVFPTLLMPSDMSVMMRLGVRCYAAMVNDTSLLKAALAFSRDLDRLKRLCCQAGATEREIREATQEVLLGATTLGPLRARAFVRLAEHEAGRGYLGRAKVLLDHAVVALAEARAQEGLGTRWLDKAGYFDSVHWNIINQYRAFGFDGEARAFIENGDSLAYIASFGSSEKPFYERTENG